MTRTQLMQVVIAISAIAVLTFLFIKARSLDYERHTYIMETMRQLKQADAVMNQDIIKSRYSLLNNYDPLVVGFWNITNLNKDLRNGLVAISRQGEAQLDEVLNKAAQLSAQKESLAEEFKSANAILRNSLYYFPVLAKEIAAASRTDKSDKLSSVTNDLAREVLTYSVNPSGTTRQEILAHSDKISNLRAGYPGDLADQMGLMLKHVQILLAKKPEVDGLLAQIITLPTAQQYDHLYNAYLTSYRQLEKSTNTYRLLLYLFSVLLLLAVAYILIKLKYSTLALGRAVNDLEQQKQALDEGKRQLQSVNADLEFQKYAMDQHAIVSIADMTGAIVYANDKFCVISQYSREELLGRNHRMLNSGFHTKRFFEEFWTTIISGKVWQGEMRNRKKDGSFYWVETTIVPLLDGSGIPYQYVSIRTEITKIKEAEAALLSANEELERRVASRTVDLEANTKQLEYYLADLTRKNEENEMFVYTVSHDLRSPLVNLQGFSRELEMVAQDLRTVLIEGNCPPEVQKRGMALIDEDMLTSLRFIQAGVVRLSNIMDGLLQLSRVGRVEYQMQHVDLKPVVRRIIESMQTIISQRGATVTVHELPAAWVDTGAVEQIFANLIGNALNYLDPKRPGLIEVGCCVDKESTHNAVLNTYYVKDNGLGISEQAKTKLFRIFQRFHPGSAKGEGIGLAIVRSMVERHGGRITVESTEGAGTTFFVALPSQEAKQAPIFSDTPAAEDVLFF